jgi:hypothetical protein
MLAEQVDMPDLEIYYALDMHCDHATAALLRKINSFKFSPGLSLTRL